MIAQLNGGADTGPLRRAPAASASRRKADAADAKVLAVVIPEVSIHIISAQGAFLNNIVLILFCGRFVCNYA